MFVFNYIVCVKNNSLLICELFQHTVLVIKSHCKSLLNNCSVYPAFANRVDPDKLASEEANSEAN